MIINNPFALVLLLSCVSGTVLSQCLTHNDSSQGMTTGSQHKLMESRLLFARDALKKMVEIETHDNIFFSPHSLYQALNLVYFGAKGKTEENLKKALVIPEDVSKSDVLQFFTYEKAVELSREENSSSNYEYKIANRLWIADSKKIRACVLDEYKSEIEKTDFKSNPEAVRLQINEWVSNMTKNNIKDLLPANSIDETSDLVLANAIYFKGKWQSQFNKAHTKREVFYTSHNNAVLTTFMKQKGTFPHGVSESLGAHILELPYKGDEVSMFIFLPPFVTSRARRNEDPAMAKMSGVQQLLHRITTTEFETFKEILEEGMMARDVEVSIPKFSIERNLPVNALLKALGADDVLSQDADLSGFLEDSNDTLHLGDAVHRAKIELNEEGTTAAAATALFSFRSSRPIEPAVFKADHPFVYVIYDKISKSILFSGYFRKPEENLGATATA